MTGVPSPRDSCSAPRSARTRSRAATRTATGGGGSTAKARPAASRPATPATSTTATATTSRCSPGFGLNAFRFGIEWARIEPAEGEFSTAQLDHYRRMLEACQRAFGHPDPHLPPLHAAEVAATTWAGSRPSDFRRLFERYCDRAAARAWRRDRRSPAPSTSRRASARAATCSASTRRATPTTTRGAQARRRQPARGAPAGAAAIRAHTQRARRGDARHPRHPVRGWRGAGQHLARGRVARSTTGSSSWRAATTSSACRPTRAFASGRRARAAPAHDWSDWTRELDETDDTTQMGYEYYPQALGGAIRRAWKSTGGDPDPGDRERDRHRRSTRSASRSWTAALREVQTCLAEGIDVRSYLHWSLLDNFEWAFGYGPTFGLVAVDRQTFARHPKPSAAWLGAGRPRSRSAPPSAASAVCVICAQHGRVDLRLRGRTSAGRCAPARRR